MYLNLYFLILIFVFMLIEKSKSDLLKNCSYEYTVDLTKSIQFKNNSYLYNNNTLITPDLVNDYNFIIFNNGTRINNVKTYKRGCICTIKNCIRFCSYKVFQLYRNGSSPDLDKRFTKNVTLSNKKSTEMHLIHDFYPIFGSVCESPELIPENNWTLFEDGILRHHLVERNLTQSEYCFDVKVFQNNSLQFLNPAVCYKTKKTKSWIQIYGFVFSIPFFIATIICFILLTNLRNVRGKCFVTYLLLLTIAYTIISFYKISGLPIRSTSCLIYGYVLYYIIMGIYTWCCILCYDAWTTLTHMVTEQPSFKKYSIIGFTIPLMMTLVKCVADCLTELPKPLNCMYLNTTPIFVILFYNLLGTLMVIYSLTLYIMILRYSWKTKREQLSYFREVQKEKVEKIMTYARILSFMGFEWIFVFVSRTLRSLYPENAKIVLICTYVAYSVKILQGPLMFLVFICSSRVRNGIKKRFTKNSSEVIINLSRKNSTKEEYRRCAAH